MLLCDETRRRCLELLLRMSLLWMRMLMRMQGGWVPRRLLEFGQPFVGNPCCPLLSSQGVVP